jgi:SRSO17 transposase
MDAQQIRSLKPKLVRFVKRFDDCFDRRDTRGHMVVYVEGQLSALHRKSVEPIAKQAGVPVRTLQEFLSLSRWNEDRLRERLQKIVAVEHASPHAVGIIDETSFAKQGHKTPGVKRQWCGCRGKKDNCVVTLHLAYAADDFHCLLDGELFLPENWNADRERCRQAGIPDTMVYRSKWEIALEMLDRAQANGVSLPWLTFDEWYGGKPGFLRGLRTRKQCFAGEVPCITTGWLKRPTVTTRPFHRHGRGRGRRTPRVVAGNRPARSVAELWEHDPKLRDQPWQRFRIRDGEQGPMVWEVKQVRFYLKEETDLPAERPMTWIVARNVLHPEEIKFFLADAPRGTPLDVLLLVGFSRWPVEHCFEDGKDELGMDHYEGRCYAGLKRHLILTMLSYLFLATVRSEWRGKKSGADSGSIARRSGCVDSILAT